MMNGETENNAGAKFIGILSLGIAGWGIYQLFFKKEEKKLEGIKKSAAASAVLKLMDSEEYPDYSKSLNTVVKEHTKGMSLNKTKQFKRKLESELNLFI